MLCSGVRPKSYKGSYPECEKGRLPAETPLVEVRVADQADGSSSAVRLRVWLGSSGIPGPIVVLRVPFLM
jgi:hypothetical protein